VPGPPPASQLEALPVNGYGGLALLVDVLAAYRLTVLLTRDTITGPVRWRLIRWAYERRDGRDTDEAERELGPTWDRAVDDDLHGADTVQELPPKLATLVRCRWCMGVWAGAAVAAARWTVPDQWAPVAWALAAATVAVLLARLED
jgi:hypothetical protein